MRSEELLAGVCRGGIHLCVAAKKKRIAAIIVFIIVENYVLWELFSSWKHNHFHCALRTEPTLAKSRPTPFKQGLEQSLSPAGRPCSSSSEPGVLATIQVAQLPFCRNYEHILKHPREFWIEVGANSRDVLRDEMQDAFDRGAFLLTFEPLLDKYAWLLTKHSHSAKRSATNDARQPLGSQHSQGIALPYAVGCSGQTTFNVAPVDGCSSLLMPRGEEFASDPNAYKWHRWVATRCATVSEQRTVPCISLEKVIEEWLEARDVNYLKIDAQGFDLQVVKSAGRMMHKLKNVLMETQCDNAAMIYKGQPNCSSVYVEMTSLGFKTEFDPTKCLDCTEMDIHFFREESLRIAWP